jgi:hypothetical protein
MAAPCYCELSNQGIFVSAGALVVEHGMMKVVETA